MLTPRSIGAWLPALVVAGGAGIVAGLWGAGGVDDIHDTATLLTGLGRVAGLLGAYLALVELLLLARLPVLDRLVGLQQLTAWHRTNGKRAWACCWRTSS